MLLIYGTRAAHHTVGYVAEECPLCREATVCRLLELSQGGHLFFIPVGSGSFPLGHEARCLTCRHPFQAPAIYYHGFGRKKKARVEELIPLTSPWLGTMGAEEMENERRFRRILDIFLSYDSSIRSRSVRGGMQFDWVGGLAVLMLIFVPMALAGLAMSNSMPLLTKSQSVAAAWIGSVAVVVWGIYMIVTEEQRFFRRKLLPRLREELAGAGARKGDWEAAMHRMKRLRFPLWKTMKKEVRRRDFPVHQQLQNTEAGVAGESVWQAPRAPLTQP
jgi:hypothetical protein